MKIKDFIIDKIVDIIAVVIALYALQASLNSSEQARRQFEKSSQRADSLFAIQLDNARQLNDSLINEISGLQKITASQLKITNRQLEIMQQSLKEQIYSGRPQIVVLSDALGDTNLSVNSMFSPTIKTELRNVGKRYANNVRFRPFIVDLAFSYIKVYQEEPLADSFIEPNGSHTTIYKPKFPLADKNEFYYCYEIAYDDAETHSEFVQSYFAKYYKSRGESRFYQCAQSEIVKLKEFINLLLQKNGAPLLKGNYF